MTTPTSRARFEEFVLAQGFSPYSLGLFESPNCMPGHEGLYTDNRVQLAWLAYQHAEAGKAEVVEALEYALLAISNFGDTNSRLASQRARRVLAGLKENEG